MILHIPAPTTIAIKEGKDFRSEVSIEPCYPGYGITLGNALRRVLLSSLPGAAVSAIKVQGIQHEYDTIEHVKEDIVEIMMNLKKLRLVCHSDEPVMLELSAKGEKVVTAADIKKNSQVEIINEDMVIATLTDKKAELIMEIMVKRGIGYEPVEERVVDKKDIGLMQIDSIFSPIQNTGLNIGHVRVGQRTDYEKVILTITTDGTMSAKEAIASAVTILQEQFAAVLEAEDAKRSKKEPKPEEEVPEEVADDAVADEKEMKVEPETKE
ncbi:MAG: DNA-directed RNA polymerase subunit alpha [Candidatus Komeilibacteria bacterium RIFCSPLOWO2_01_FULL_53_11]|uniref:DNA-directed RNA polymerase subunit alpha n=1 Tax=Candidatus Komeilibacteria bacterium RIFCSPLOWO2_01_FULL_53_11 TaxID=1798552 RepID=A0A1G2BVI9_9BACT|nr:MAG: DNA-directed RNA polymerase subunit alpha [Candidatus Komeilibacteria bacterium RIFCSPLOWO2_01_FULL_53_11]